MTKDELINAVIKSCKDDGLTKRLAGDVVDAAFENISKAIKKEKRFAYPSWVNSFHVLFRLGTDHSSYISISNLCMAYNNSG